MESCTGDTTMSAWSGVFPVYTCTWAVVAGCTSGVIRLTLVATRTPWQPVQPVPSPA